MLRAKTGTLTGVDALAGQVVDRSGRLLLFAFLTSARTVAGADGARARSSCAARLARCGCGG